MTNSSLLKKKEKIDQLEKSLVNLWDSMSPNLRGKKILWDKFLNVQTKVRLLNLKIERNLKYEATK